MIKEGRVYSVWTDSFVNLNGTSKPTSRSPIVGIADMGNGSGRPLDGPLARLDGLHAPEGLEGLVVVGLHVVEGRLPELVPQLREAGRRTLPRGGKGAADPTPTAGRARKEGLGGPSLREGRGVKLA